MEVFFHGICDSSTSGLTSLLEKILTYKIGEVNFKKVAKIEMYFVTLKSSGRQRLSLLNIYMSFSSFKLLQIFVGNVVYF